MKCQIKPLTKKQKAYYRGLAKKFDKARAKGTLPKKTVKFLDKWCDDVDKLCAEADELIAEFKKKTKV